MLYQILTRPEQNRIDLYRSLKIYEILSFIVSLRLTLLFEEEHQSNFYIGLDFNPDP